MYVDSAELKRACAAMREFKNSDTTPYGVNAKKHFMSFEGKPSQIILRTSSSEIVINAEGTDFFEPQIIEMPKSTDLLSKGQTEIALQNNALKIYRRFYEIAGEDLIKKLKEPSSPLSCLGRFQFVFEAFKFLRPSISTDLTRIWINMLHITQEGKNMIGVATDGHRLHTAQFGPSAFLAEDVDKIQIALNPIKAVLKLKKQFDPNCLVYASDDRIVIEGHTFHDCFASSADTKFAPYDQVIPKSFDRKFAFNRKELKGVLSELQKDSTSGVVLEFKDGLVELTQDCGYKSQLAFVSLLGEDELRLGVNAKYLKEACDVGKSETIIFKAGGPLDPLLIVDDIDYRAVVMPMRI